MRRSVALGAFDADISRAMVVLVFVQITWGGELSCLRFRDVSPQLHLQLFPLLSLIPPSLRYPVFTVNTAPPFELQPPFPHFHPRPLHPVPPSLESRSNCMHRYQPAIPLAFNSKLYISHIECLDLLTHHIMLRNSDSESQYG